MVHANTGKKLRGIKLLRNAAKVMTGSFKRVDDNVRTKYESNRRKLKVHFKSTVSNLKMHKDLRIGDANMANAIIQTAIDKETSPMAIHELNIIITKSKKEQEKGNRINRSTLDMIALGER